MKYNDQAQKELVAFLKGMPPEEFEKLKKEWLPNYNSINSSHNQDITQVDEASTKSSR